MTISSVPDVKLTEVQSEITTVQIYVCGLCMTIFNTRQLWRCHMFDTHNFPKPKSTQDSVPATVGQIPTTSTNLQPVEVRHSYPAPSVSKVFSVLSSIPPSYFYAGGRLHGSLNRPTCSVVTSWSNACKSHLTQSKPSPTVIVSVTKPSSNVYVAVSRSNSMPFSCYTISTSPKAGTSTTNCLLSSAGVRSSPWIAPSKIKRSNFIVVLAKQQPSNISKASSLMPRQMPALTFKPDQISKSTITSKVTTTSKSTTTTKTTMALSKSSTAPKSVPACTSDPALISSTKQSEEEILAQTENEILDESVGLAPIPFKKFKRLILNKKCIKCGFSSICPFKFEDECKMNLHQSCHTSETRQDYKCFECKMEFNNWQDCSLHLWKTHKVEVDLLKCLVCPFKAKSTVAVWRHMRMHNKWRPMVSRSLEQNNQPSQEDKPKENASVQRNRYYSEKTCSTCNRKFANGKTLSKHIKTVHNKIKPFSCNVCGMNTARKASLVIHMRQHTGEKPLTCSLCKFATRDPSVLHKHQLRHDKNEKIKCSFCDYMCIQTISYKRHLRQQHPEEFKKVACNLCNFVTISADKLERHLEDHRCGLVANGDDPLYASASAGFKGPGKIDDKDSQDCFHPLESVDSLPHEPTVDTGGVTIPAPPSEETQFPFNITE